MAAHTLLGGKGSTTAKQTADLGIGRNEWSMVGDSKTRIIVVPRLATAATTHGAFAAGGDVITAFGVVTNR